MDHRDLLLRIKYHPGHRHLHRYDARTFQVQASIDPSPDYSIRHWRDIVEIPHRNRQPNCVSLLNM